MTPLEEMMQSIVDKTRREKLAREMEHKPAPLRPDQLKGRNALTDWSIGMFGRLSNPVKAIGNYVQEFQKMPIEEQALQMVGGGMAGTFAGVGAKTADIVKLSLDKKMKESAKTKYQLAHEVAQRNAAKPISEGGLGLPADNMALDRAKAMGFDTPAYHGTLSDINEFDPLLLGKYNKHPIASLGTFVSNDPKAVNMLLKTANKNSGQNILPLLINKGNSLELSPPQARLFSQRKNPDNDPMQQLDSLLRNTNIDNLKTDIRDENGIKDWYATLRQNVHGFNKTLDNNSTDTITLNNSYDMPARKVGRNHYDPSTQYIVRNPANIRSRFAAFDPARRNEFDILGNIDPQLLKILGGASAAGLLGAGGYSAMKDK